MLSPRARSQATSLGTSSTAAVTPGLEKIPMVLISGIQEEFLVPFRAQDRALDDVRSKAHLSHGVYHAVAGGAVQLGVPHDAALSNLPPPGFKLGLDEYNHFRVRA